MARRKATPKPAKPRVAKDKPLTVKEQLFVSYYLGSAEANGSEAARRAGYSHVAVTACQLLRKPNIRAAIEARLGAIQMEQDEVLIRLSEMARASIDEFITIDKAGVPRVNLKAARTNGRLFLVKSLKWTRYGPSIELYSALDALDKLGQMLGMYQAVDDDKPAPPIDPALAALLLEMAERAQAGKTTKDVREK